LLHQPFLTQRREGAKKRSCWWLSLGIFASWRLGWEELLHQPFFVGLEGFELLGLRGDEVV
jgi:hypothetical protein